MVERAISETIDVHRDSRAVQQEDYTPPIGPPTDEEINDFIFHNAQLDEETVEQLIDPGFLGFSAKTARATEKWLSEFSENIKSWSNNESWLGADEPIRGFLYLTEPEETQLWTPSTNLSIPNWVETSPTYILLALDFCDKANFCLN